MKNWTRLLILLFAAGGCILLLGLLFLYVGDASSRALPTFPRVTITSSVPERTGVVNHPVVVFGQASDPDGIGSAELWVNGTRVASQANPASASAPFEISQSWIPDGPGSYLFLLRGLDRKGFAGESSPVVIQITERTDASDPSAERQYVVQPGDTIASIAAHFGTTPEEIRRLNPDLTDPIPGSSVRVPPRPEPPAGTSASSSPAGEGDEPPHVAPAAEPPPAGGTPAAPASRPWWGALPLPGSWGCIFDPAMCAPPVGGETSPAPATGVHAEVVDGCHVSVSWTDSSSSEVGFRVYRLVMRPRFRSDLLALLAPAGGTGTRLTYEDTAAPTGRFFYAIVTLSIRGAEVWSAPSEEVATTCPSAPSGAGTSIDLEALEMTVADASTARIYCYVSLAASPFERIPPGAGDFLSAESGTWNIAEYASGDNKRTLIVDGARPLEIVAACLGRQGGTLVDMGRFTRSHPPAEWDGRLLTAGPDSGAFSVTYRIQPTPPAGSGGRGGGTDPTVPAPFNLRATDSWLSCARRVGDRISCASVAEPGLSWDYTVDPVVPRPPLHYRVYTRSEASASASLAYTTLDDHRSAPRGECEHAFYSVSAILGIDPTTGEEIESPASETLEASPTCGQLEVTLDHMWVYRGGEDAYGSFWFNGVPVIWNIGPCSGGALCGGAPSYTSVSETTDYSWANMFLSVASGRFGRGHNVFRVPIQDGEPLRMTLQLWDHYIAASDEVWCGYWAHRAHAIMAARSLAEWLTVDEDVTAYDGATVPVSLGAIDCNLYIHVRGVP